MCVPPRTTLKVWVIDSVSMLSDLSNIIYPRMRVTALSGSYIRGPEWLAQRLRTHYFLFRGQWTLSYDTFTKAVKSVARSFGLDPTRFSSHSLRIGGASALAAANVPDYVIQKLGRWTSLAFLAYLRMSHSAFDKALDVLVDPSNLQVRELSLIHAGL